MAWDEDMFPNVMYVCDVLVEYNSYTSGIVMLWVNGGDDVEPLME